MAKVLETRLCSCVASTEDLSADQRCTICKGSGQVPLSPGVAWLWADWKWRDEKPPSEIPLPEAKPLPPEAKPMAVAKPLKPILPDWAPSERSALRERALQYTLGFAQLMNVKLLGGADLLLEAEAVERWIVDSTEKETT